MGIVDSVANDNTVNVCSVKFLCYLTAVTVQTLHIGLPSNDSNVRLGASLNKEQSLTCGS